MMGGTNPVFRLTTANKVVWGRTSAEVNLVSRILFEILEVGKKLLATDRILESIDSKMNNFTVVVQN
jgi:hypothetical protein